MFFRGAEDFHDARELFLLVLAREDGEAGEELGEDAAEAPHVDWHAIGHAKDDFWGSVESRLYVRVYLFVF